MTASPPTLLAVSSPSGLTCSAWCRYCDKFHTHANSDGHVVAHCYVDDSPYRQTGYVLKVVPGDTSTLRPPRSDRRRPRSDRFGGISHGWPEDAP